MRNFQNDSLLINVYNQTFRIFARLKRPPDAFLFNWAIIRPASGTITLGQPIAMPELHAKFHQNRCCHFGEKCEQDNDIV